MRTINITFNQREFSRLKRLKRECKAKNWEDAIMCWASVYDISLENGAGQDIQK